MAKYATGDMIWRIDQIKEFIMVNGYDDIDKICSSSLKKAVETKNTKQYQLRNSVGYT